MTLIPFLFLDASNTAKYMERWKPQMIADQLVSVSGVNAYARAHIHLRHPDCVGMLVNLHDMGYVIHRGEDATYNIMCCLWPTGEPSLQGFRDFREWCDCTLDVRMNGTSLEDDLERELWELSLFDA
tara:strand:+ start:777 stop:1157 length:381 start_codon:yes stop_codon:yes gene_type:complete